MGSATAQEQHAGTAQAVEPGENVTDRDDCTATVLDVGGVT